MTALDDAIAKGDKVLSWAVSADVAKVVLDMSRALKAVAEALDENDIGMTTASVAIIRAAIERRLGGKP